MKFPCPCWRNPSDKFGPLAKIDLPQVNQTLHQLGKLLQVSAEFQDSDSLGQPGRKTTTEDIALFACVRRTGDDRRTWKEIYSDWKKEHPTDDRMTNWQQIREAHRRHYGDKARQ